MSAPSMVYGKDLLENAKRLADLVDNIEIVLFNTPTLNNTPDDNELQLLSNLGKKKNLTFTVHLPASLEIASKDVDLRKNAIDLATGLCKKTEIINPKYYILHIPFTKPTLAPVPGLYFKEGEGHNWEEWTQRALSAIETIQGETGIAGKLLVENINYSPSFLEPFLDGGTCGFCLDAGHLLLGSESVNEALMRYQKHIRELHIHGVRGVEEHLSLSVLPVERVTRWMATLTKIEFNGVLNLEVFSPGDLKGSLAFISKALLPGENRFDATQTPG